MDLSITVVLSFLMLPVELLIIVLFQKYSSHTDEILGYPSLNQVDFSGDRLLGSGKILVFFYAEWCPFCHRAFHHLASLSSISYKVYGVDLSDEDNPLWTSLNIRRIPTLIAFHNGEELRRREATYMVGLRKADFAEVDSVLKN